MNILVAFGMLTVILSYLALIVGSAELSLRFFGDNFSLYFFMSFFFLGVGGIFLTKFWFMVGAF